jgi:hypothetical protein
VAVDAIDGYWSAPQVVKLAQVRSLVGVARTDSYWLAVHVVRDAQVRSDEDVAATVSYCHWVQMVKAWQGSVIETRYWPAGQPYGSAIGERKPRRIKRQTSIKVVLHVAAAHSNRLCDDSPKGQTGHLDRVRASNEPLQRILAVAVGASSDARTLKHGDVGPKVDLALELHSAKDAVAGDCER